MRISNKNFVVLAVLLLAITTISTVTVLTRPSVVVNARAVGDVTAYVGVDTTITLPTYSAVFGNITQGSVNDTLDGKPGPMILQNDGSIKVNVTIYASNLWADVLGVNPSNYYRFLANQSGEGGAGWCFDGNVTASNVSWTQMPPSSGRFVGLLDNPDDCDSSEIEVEVTAPSDEPAGNKESTLTLTASQG